MLLVAGHGGTEPLPGAEVRRPERVKDPNFVVLGDSLTNELASDLAQAIARESEGGARPSLLLNRVHRRYCDVNRSPELSSHDPRGRAHHAAFHQALAGELRRLQRQHGWVLLLDLHGQSRYPISLHLGTAQHALVSPATVDWLWGPGGLVAELQDHGFQVAPAQKEAKQRYPGGYIVRHHAAPGRVEACQMEHSRALRQGQEDRERYLAVLARSLAQRITAHSIRAPRR